MLFYVIFYAVLSGFFGAMLAVFYQTLDPNAPKWQLDNSLIGSNPGLGFRPMPPESNVESTLIWYKASDEGNYLHWTRELDKFLEGKKKNTWNTIYSVKAVARSMFLWKYILKKCFSMVNQLFNNKYRYEIFNNTYDF